MANRLTSLTSPTALQLLAQLVRKQLLPVPVPEVSSPLSGDGSAESPLSIPSPLPIANGGTGGNSAPTAGGIAYGNGSKHAFTAAGVAGQLLRSGGAGAPTWLTPAPAPGLRVLSGDAETTLDTASDIDADFRWALRGGDVLSLQAYLSLVGAANSAPRVSVDVGGEYATGRVRVLEWITSETVPAWQHLNVGVLSTQNTSTGLANPTIWEISAVLLATSYCTVALKFAGSRPTTTICQKGSFALFNHLEA